MPKRQLSVAQLDFERRALLAELDYGQLNEPAARDLMRRIEDLDLAIAATPAQSLSDLATKLDRLADVLKAGLAPGSVTLESVLLKALLHDAKRLSAITR